MKRCYFCKEQKPVSDFNRDRSRGDGLQNRCRCCQLKANREWAQRHPEVRRSALRRQYAQEVTRRPTKQSPREKKRAHYAVEMAIKKGLMARPSACSRCGRTQFPIHGHHENYSKPLDVIWLCAPCHGEAHSRRAA